MLTAKHSARTQRTLPQSRECFADHSRLGFRSQCFVVSSHILLLDVGGLLHANCDEDPCAEPLLAIPSQIQGGESSSDFPLATSREVVVTSNGIGRGRLRARHSFRTSCTRACRVDLIAPADHPCSATLGGTWRQALCVGGIEAENGCGLKTCHSEVRKCSPVTSDHSAEKW